MIEMKQLSRDIIHAGKMMLREYGNQLTEPGHLKEKLSLVLLARAVRQLQAIGALVQSTFVSDGWILYRSLLEKYFLFRHLCKTGEFDVFDDWCFKGRYEHLNMIKSIREFKGKPQMRDRRFRDEEKTRYQRVRDDQRVKQWRRPDMESIARELEMKFLYDAGYDWASGYVHPTSQDGSEDYWILMGRECDEIGDDSEVLLHNAPLITVLHIQYFMNEPEYNWRKVLYDLIDAFAKAADGEGFDYAEGLAKVTWFHESGGGLFVRKAD